MTVTTHDLRVHPDLLAFLDEREIRYELIDGCVVVSPPAGFPHEDLQVAIAAQLWHAAPKELAVVGSNLGFWYADPSFVLPDVVVARRADAEERGVFVAPLLVVEVLSPSTRRRDLLVKRSIYAEAGVPSYWLVDPVEPALTVLSLRDGEYLQTARTAGAQELPVDEPFPVTIRLSR